MLTADQIIQKLLDEKFEAYYVGGCVRDKLLGIPCTDEDIVTNAKPHEIDAIFKKISTVKHIGKLFGVVQIDGFEVATYRSDTYHGSDLIIGTVGTLIEDCVRRDFTINALASDLNGVIIDHTNGLADLHNKIIRANGDPLIRFTEDPSRILRAIYLSVKLGFEIESNTLNTLLQNGGLIKQIEPNVIGRILTKVHKNKLFRQFVRKLTEYHLLEVVFGVKSCTHLDKLDCNNELISYAILYTDQIDTDEYDDILESYLIPKNKIKQIESMICFSSRMFKTNEIRWGLTKQMINRAGLNELISMMITYFRTINPDYDFTRFQSKYDSTIYYPHELPINGHDLMKRGFTGKGLGMILDDLVENNCRTIDQCEEFLAKKPSDRILIMDKHKKFLAEMTN
jgi:tRNA nucleotidyltransferase/poly(A) polymerase